MNDPLRKPLSLLEVARFRAASLVRARDFFTERGVLEVETPLLSGGVSLDVHLDFFSARFHPEGWREGAGSGDFYLQTSPEPHLKRLLCQGFPDLFQITKAFRNGEAGLRHNPEFTLVEWYRRDWELKAMADETLDFCRLIAGPRPVIQYHWEEAFRTMLGVDPLHTDRQTLLSRPEILENGLSSRDFPADADIFDFLMSHGVEPKLDPSVYTLIDQFPISQAAQSQAHPQHPGLALRFEIFSGGLEIGNGYQELIDASEYRRRFEDYRQARKALQKPCPKADESLLNLLEQPGLPACSGVAVGFDRLIMLALGLKSIRQALLFPWGEN